MEIVNFFKGLVAGRVNRKQYFLQQLFVIFGVVGVVGIALSAYYLLRIPNSPFVSLVIISAIISLIALTVYSYTSIIKRLHDMNIGGPLTIIAFVVINSVLGGLPGFTLLFIPGNKGVNEYGMQS